jgi:type IV pilus assembly protein PilE
MNTNKKTHLGFTLIELMMVVVIVGILARVAIPSYMSYLEKGRLTTAKGIMQEMAQLVERSYSLNNAYPAASAIPTSLTQSPKVGESTKKYYDITYTLTASDSYTIVATAASGYTPSTCPKLQLNSTGEKLASNSLNGTPDAATGALCW